MDEGDLKELRELIEFLKLSGIAEFDMERPDMKVRLKFAGPSEVAAGGGVSSLDLASLARMMGAAAGPQSASVPMITGSAESAAAATASADVGPEATPVEADEDAGLHMVRSPLVGTFYDAASPGADAFVKVGDTVSSGDVLCIVEAMKIMNEIESDAGGTIVKVHVKPGQPVEYGQKLFGIRA